MNVSKKFIKYNYEPNNTPQWIVIHCTDNKTANAQNHYDYWNSGNVGSSAHYVVDDKQIIQMIEHKNKAWHNGKKYIANPKYPQCTNSNSIGIEICNASHLEFDKCVENAIWLVKKLMNEIGIDISHVITHYDSCGKPCPSTILNTTNGWNNFKTKVLENNKVKAPQWQIDAIKSMCKQYNLDEKLWLSKANDNLTVGEFFGILIKVVK